MALMETSYTIEPIGVVRSGLTRLEAAPLQGDEGAPEAWLELTPRVAQGVRRGVPVGAPRPRRSGSYCALVLLPSMIVVHWPPSPCISHLKL
jgi:hypothetical protein